MNRSAVAVEYETELDAGLTEKQVAEMLQLPASTLRYWRLKGEGPRFFHIGKLVRYRRSAVREFMEQCYKEETL
jgi:predicted DNA-binding transcriptional regulator AlpA